MKSKNMIKNILAGTVIMIMVLSLNSCAKKITFLNSSTVPGAQGTVKLKKDDNNNYLIQIELSDLAEARKLQPPRETYVVWMLTDQQIPKNIGQINSSSGIFSSRLKAEFETVSPVKPTKIFITAENDPGVQYPGMVIISTASF